MGAENVSDFSHKQSVLGQKGLLLENPKGNKGKPAAMPRYLRSNQGIPLHWIHHSGEKPQSGSNASGILDPIPLEG